MYRAKTNNASSQKLLFLTFAPQHTYALRLTHSWMSVPNGMVVRVSFSPSQQQYRSAFVFFSLKNWTWCVFFSLGFMTGYRSCCLESYDFLCCLNERAYLFGIVCTVTVVMWMCRASPWKRDISFSRCGLVLVCYCWEKKYPAATQNPPSFSKHNLSLGKGFSIA